MDFRGEVIYKVNRNNNNLNKLNNNNKYRGILSNNSRRRVDSGILKGNSSQSSLKHKDRHKALDKKEIGGRSEYNIK